MSCPTPTSPSSWKTSARSPNGRKPVSRSKPIINSEEDLDKLTLPEFLPGTRQGNRLEILRQVAAKEKGNRYIFGICIGPFTEYCNARGIKKAMHDMKKRPEMMKKGIDLFFRNGMRFIEAQLEAGADGIQIVEPNCSLISEIL